MMPNQVVAANSDPRRKAGERLAVRPVSADDVEKLAALYDNLDGDDRHDRFLGHYRPPRALIERIATVGDRGGAGLVAAVVDPDGTERQLEGEVGYTLLPDGNGELAITVTPRWRGWLGPYLLDALRATAADRGVPNLATDVLTTDRSMIAMLRRRGAVCVEHSGWRVVRLLIGTSGPTPSWSGPHDRPRVLVEGSGGRWHAEDEARAAGMHVVTCSGPTARPCPEVAGEVCPLVAGADVVVVADHCPGAAWHDLLRSRSQRHPGVPVYFEPTRFDAAAAGSDPTCPVVTAAGAVAFVERLARQREEAGW